MLYTVWRCLLTVMIQDLSQMSTVEDDERLFLDVRSHEI